MGVVCQILLKKTKEGIYNAGQVVSGVVKYTIDKPTEYKAITLSLLGTGECDWCEYRVNWTATFHGSEKYVTIHLHILNQEKAIDIGSYEYPFEFHLPDELPSSFKNETCTIKYNIELAFEKKNFFSFNKKFTTEIPVCGVIKPSTEGPLIFGLEKSPFNLFSSVKPMIKVKAELAKTYLSPGENAQLSVVVTNVTDIIPTVQAELFCHTVYTADCGGKNESVEKVKDCNTDSHDIPKRGVVTLSLTLPTGAELYTIDTKVMKREYKVRVTVRLPMPHLNTFVETRVAIGKRMGNEEPDLEMDDEPPSYWAAMNEDKEKK